MLIISMILPGVSTLASSSTTVAGTIPLNVYNVQVINITTTSATISWDTNNPTGVSVTSQVSYGITTGYGKSVSDNSSEHHSVDISGLLPGTVYDYQIQSAIVGFTATPFTGSFKTLAAPPITPTNIMLTSFPNPSYCGQTVYFGVVVMTSSLKSIATGTVTLMDNTTNKVLGTSQLLFGLTFFNINSLTVGSHNITAVYAGNSNFASSTSNVVVEKVMAKTVCTWPIKPTPCNFGQLIKFAVHIGVQSPGTGNPIGNVTFYDGDHSLGTGSWSGDVAVLNCFLSAGSHNITAKYSGDNNYDASTSDVINQIVNKANSTITLNSSLNPGKATNTVTFTAKITPNTATGTVTFKDGGKTLGIVTLSAGQATFSTKLSVGTHSIIAVYNGDGNFNTSASNTISQVIK